MSKHEGLVRTLPGVAHQGTEAFGKRVARKRKQAKAARKARRKGRKCK